MGTPDGSVPSCKLEPTGNGKIDRIALEVTIDAARTYLGPYSREEMATALDPLVVENKINCDFLVQLIKNAENKHVDTLSGKVEGKFKKVFITAREVNAILITCEKMELITLDFEKGEIWWVCQEQPCGSFLSCLTILPSSYSFRKPLYFCGKNGRKMAEEFAIAFADDKRLSNNEPVYLKEVIKTTSGFRTKDLLVL